VSVQQAIESRSGISQRYVVDAVFDLSAIAVVLSLHAGCVVTALGRPSLVNATDRLGTCVLGSNDLLTTVSQLLLIPNDRFEEPLQCSGRDLLIQRDRFHILSLHV
jgi:hypothetical protein